MNSTSTSKNNCSKPKELVQAFINWYGYENTVWQLQAEGYKSETTDKLQGAQGDQLKQQR